MGESGGGRCHSQAVLVGELARTSQAGRGERLGPRPLAAICSFTHRLGLPLLVRQQNSCPLTRETVGMAQNKGGLW